MKKGVPELENARQHCNILQGNFLWRVATFKSSLGAARHSVAYIIKASELRKPYLKSAKLHTVVSLNELLKSFCRSSENVCELFVWATIFLPNKV